MSCGLDRRHSSVLALLWLWHRLAAVAPVRPLAWEPPHVAGAALKKKKSLILRGTIIYVPPKGDGTSSTQTQHYLIMLQPNLKDVKL